MRKLNGFAGLLGVWLLGVLFLPASAKSEEPKPKQMSFKGPIEPNTLVSVSCPLRATDRAQITKLLVKKGDYVVKGQLLAQLDDREAHLGFMQSVVEYNDESGIRRAEDVVVLRDAEMRRYEELVRQKAASAHDLDLAKAQRAVAVADLEQGYAKRIEAATTMEFQAKQLADRLVLAPLSGVVVQTQLDEGEVAQGGAPIVDLIDVETLFVRLDLDVNLIGKVKAGDKAEVALDLQPDKKYEGVVEYVSPIADPTANTYLVRVEVKNPAKLKEARRVRVYQIEEVEKARAGKVRQHRGVSTALDAIVKILETPENLSASAQLELARALAYTGDARALPGLTAVLEKGDSEKRQEAVRALGHLRSEKSVDLLIKTLEDTNSDVRWWAENSLSKLGSMAVDKLVAVVSSGSKEASTSAASALAQIVLRNVMLSPIGEGYTRALEAITAGYANPADYVVACEEKEVAQRDYEIMPGLYAQVTFPHLAK